jgi:hypothetical protein
LRKVCDNILQYKKKIKNLFSDLEEIIKLNVELYQLSFYYHNHVIFEPMEAKLYDKKITMLKQQISIEFGRENFLYTIDKNAFVASVSFQTENIGHVIWASNNTKDILEIDEKLLRSLHINSIMPKVISNVHDDFLHQYLKVAKSNLINNYKDLWGLTYKKKLFSMKSCVKLYFEQTGLHLISFIKKSNDKTSLIINEYGEIDSFGEFFYTMTNIEYDFCFSNLNISIFCFMPQMIINFLSFYYDLENFKIQDFPYSALEDTFLMVFKDMGSKILDLSKILKLNSGNKEAYANDLYTYLSELKFENLEKVYRVRIKINYFSYQKSEAGVKLWDFKFTDFIDVTNKFKSEHFDQQKSFLEKIKFDESLRVSIEKYNNRLLEQQANHLDLNNEDELKKTKFGKSHSNNDVRSLTKRRSTKLSFNYDKDIESETESLVTEKSGKNEEHERNSKNKRSQHLQKSTGVFGLAQAERNANAEKGNELEEYKATAINIIRKLFTKNFNPLKEKEQTTGSRKKWIDSINNYIQKRNSIISTIVEYHIGILNRKPSKDL